MTPPPATPDRTSVLAVARELAALGRLDKKSCRRLPARLTTLLRRTVEATPYELACTLRGVAPPPRRAPAAGYARALLALFEAYDGLSARRLTHSVDRIRQCLDALATAAGAPPPPEAARARVVEDAFLWKAAFLHREGWVEEHLALAEGHVALAGEGLLPTGYAAMRAAAFLAVDATHRPDYERAARYATFALRCRAPDWYAFPGPLADCVTILRQAGEHERVVELGPPLLERYTPFDELDAETMPAPESYTSFVVQVGTDVAISWSELGAHAAALASAGSALWRAIRRFGPDDPLSQACQRVLADRLFTAGRHEDAVAMARPVFEFLRRRADAAPRDYVYTGIRLAIGLDRIGNLTEAREISAEVAAFAARRLSHDDPAFSDAEQTLRHLESRT